MVTKVAQVNHWQGIILKHQYISEVLYLKVVYFHN